MSEKDKEQNPPVEQPKEKEREIKITVDNKQTELLAKQLTEAQAEKKAMEEKLVKMETDRKTQEEVSKKAAEDLEDLKNKLGIIAEKELEKKRNSVKDKANALLKDPERVKEIEQKLSTPEGIAAMEYTMNVLEKQLKIGEAEFKSYQEAERKKAEETVKKAADDKAAADKATAEALAKGEKPPAPPAGTAPLNAQQLGNPTEQDWKKIKFESYGAMIRYLQEVEQSQDKLRAAEAKTALDALLQKWASLVKANRDAMTNIPPESLDKNTQPLFKDIGLSKRAREELERRKRGEPAQNVVPS